jgi:hypothetical protein
MFSWIWKTVMGGEAKAEEIALKEGTLKEGTADYEASANKDKKAAVVTVSEATKASPVTPRTVEQSPPTKENSGGQKENSEGKGERTKRPAKDVVDGKTEAPQAKRSRTGVKTTKSKKAASVTPQKKNKKSTRTNQSAKVNARV